MKGKAAFTHKTNFINDEISLRFPSSYPTAVES